MLFLQAIPRGPTCQTMRNPPLPEFTDATKAFGPIPAAAGVFLWHIRLQGRVHTTGNNCTNATERIHEIEDAPMLFIPPVL